MSNAIKYFYKYGGATKRPVDTLDQLLNDLNQLDIKKADRADCNEINQALEKIHNDVKRLKEYLPTIEIEAKSKADKNETYSALSLFSEKIEKIDMLIDALNALSDKVDKTVYALLALAQNLDNEDVVNLDADKETTVKDKLY